MTLLLAGGVGGAKMVHGFALAEPDDGLQVIVNTADDFRLYGLHISPDIDTVVYTLAGLANPATGWGIAGDTFNTLNGIAGYGNDPWFTLGDRDFATHILRSDALARGDSLTAITQSLSAGLGVAATILPMTDNPVQTVIVTPDGDLAFQDYFVRRRQQDEVIGVRFAGIETALPTREAVEALKRAELVVMAPSNPIVSVGPILALEGMRETIESIDAIRIGVSPLIGGKAVKGPADRMMASLGHDSSAIGVAGLYHGLIDGFVIDEVDRDDQEAIEDLGMAVLVTDTMMRNETDRKRLATEILEFSGTIARAVE